MGLISSFSLETSANAATKAFSSDWRGKIFKKMCNHRKDWTSISEARWNVRSWENVGFDWPFSWRRQAVKNMLWCFWRTAELSKKILENRNRKKRHRKCKTRKSFLLLIIEIIFYSSNRSFKRRFDCHENDQDCE